MWPGRPRSACEHLERLGLDALPRGEENGGIEVPLHGTVRDLLPPHVERDPPVEADHVAARGGHLLEQRRRPRAEVDRRDVDGGEDTRRIRGDVLAVVAGRERAHPRVEQLDHVGAGARLRGDVAGEHVGEPLEQRVPDRRLRQHQLLCDRELTARLALDQVAGDR